MGKTTQSQPLISVVVPVYNSGKTLARCLQGLQAQTYPRLEIVAVYLDSQDDTLPILQAFKGLPLQLVHQTDKTGPGGARNLGVQAAQGDYIGFVEADDTIPPDFYERLEAAITQDGSDIAMGVTYYSGKPKVRFSRRRKVSGFAASFWRLDNGGTFDKLFRAGLIKPLRFAEKCRWEDNPFVLQAFWNAKQVSLVPQAHYYYEPSLWSESYCEQLKKDALHIWQEMIDFINRQPQATWKDKALVKWKSYCFFIGPLVQDPVFDESFGRLVGWPWWFKVLYYRRKFKRFIHQFYRRKKHD